MQVFGGPEFSVDEYLLRQRRAEQSLEGTARELRAQIGGLRSERLAVLTAHFDRFTALAAALSAASEAVAACRPQCAAVAADLRRWVAALGAAEADEADRREMLAAVREKRAAVEQMADAHRFLEELGKAPGKTVEDLEAGAVLASALAALAEGPLQGTPLGRRVSAQLAASEPTVRDGLCAALVAPAATDDVIAAALRALLQLPDTAAAVSAAARRFAADVARPALMTSSAVTAAADAEAFYGAAAAAVGGGRCGAVLRAAAAVRGPFDFGSAALAEADRLLAETVPGAASFAFPDAFLRGFRAFRAFAAALETLCGGRPLAAMTSSVARWNCGGFYALRQQELVLALEQALLAVRPMTSSALYRLRATETLAEGLLRCYSPEFLFVAPLAARAAALSLKLLARFARWLEGAAADPPADEPWRSLPRTTAASAAAADAAALAAFIRGPLTAAASAAMMSSGFPAAVAPLTAAFEEAAKELMTSSAAAGVRLVEGAAAACVAALKPPGTELKQSDADAVFEPLRELAPTAAATAAETVLTAFQTMCADALMTASHHDDLTSRMTSSLNTGKMAGKLCEQIKRNVELLGAALGRLGLRSKELPAFKALEEFIAVQS